VSERRTVPCPECGGSGVCSECGGSGLAPIEEDPGACHTCGGSRQCPACAGSGEVPGDAAQP
jgi:hypothetical protein